MKYVKSLFNFYINSSLHVALSVYALAWITLIKFDLPHNEDILYFIFFATITGYNFVKYFGVAKWHHRSLANWLKIIQLFSLLCFFLMCYYAFRLNLNTLIWIFCMGGVTFLYAIPFIPKRFYIDDQKNLRSVSGLKIYVIATVWAGVTVLLPVLENNIEFNTDVLFTFLQTYILVVVLMLPFEIRDLKYDNLKLATIPQKIGVKKTKAMGAILLIIFFFLEFFKDIISLEIIIISALIGVLLFLLLFFAKKDQGNYYSAFWVEGVPILWLVLMFMFS